MSRKSEKHIFQATKSITSLTLFETFGTSLVFYLTVAAGVAVLTLADPVAVALGVTLGLVLGEALTLAWGVGLKTGLGVTITSGVGIGLGLVAL